MTSISGGQSSAYMAANYPADYLVFALVRSSDKSMAFKDPYLKKWVESKINKRFIATLEDDLVIQTMYDLEQYIGKEITFVAGITFDELIYNQGVLPNATRRFCTSLLKIKPIFDWWRINIKKPIISNIGFRANEVNRVEKMKGRLNADGLTVQKAVIATSETGRRTWTNIGWQKPQFPLFEDGLLKEDIIDFWEDKPVRFAKISNCIGCFNKRVSTLKHQATKHPEKFDWFIKQEKKNKKSSWIANINYENIKKIPEQKSLFTDDHCDSGFCGY